MQPDIFPPAYVASGYESELYGKWAASGAFAPSGDRSKPPFSLMMPPMNANGDLHMGHALTVAVEDALTRWHRMRGFRTLMLPGTDHAGFETQVVFEKKLEKEGRSRFQMTREQFRQEALAFTLANRGNIEGQIRLMGASCDWSANRFTLDEPVVERVYATFRQLYEEGLIYRGERIVNYSVKYRTAYSDIEVVHEERVSPLYYLKYGPLTVATVRPETVFGDVAVAVHPEDGRYRHLVGTEIEVMTPAGTTRRLPVIADGYVDPAFGTGALKITPGHDPNDFEIAERHGLLKPGVIGLDGKLTEAAGEFAGLKAAEARLKVAERLRELGALEKVDAGYRSNVALCYKSLQPIEPLIMPQWYVKVGPLAEAAMAALDRGEVKIVPEGASAQLRSWLLNLRDWNISRQIWWGIPIGGAMPDVPAVAGDPDTFDTWFSSAQWPVAALEALGDEAAADFYPTTVMETGRDILFPWVSRMLMLGLKLRGQVPFKTVYLHGMVLDKAGKKMSKSKGNVVSPVELAAKYGTDALRYGLLVGMAAAGDIPLPEEKIVGGRNFANKIWNVTRFVMMKLDGRPPSGFEAPRAATDADRAVLAALEAAVREVHGHLEDFRFAQALQAAHEFTWHVFADVYVEASKGQLGDDGRTDAATCAVLLHCLDTMLRLLHPFMPFVTEAAWERLPERESLLISARWPVS